jgi:hypothetical protein
MNPWALLVIILGLVLIITGVKGTQHNIGKVITGAPMQSSGQQPATPGSGPKSKPAQPANPKHLPTVPPVQMM